MNKIVLTAERLRASLDYNEETGEFRRRHKKNARWPAGEVVGCASTVNKKSGLKYLFVFLHGRLYRAHRLAWLYVNGVWPSECIDHIDGDGLNNRIANLREATRAENNRNTGARRTNASGLKGVSWNKKDKRWRADISLNGKGIYIGNFLTPEEAHKAYAEAADRLHAEFARTE